MKVVIFGSWKVSMKNDWELRESKDLFENICFNLGSKIAQKGHSIIVGSLSANTADFHVVKGIVEEFKNKSLNYPLVKVLRPKSKYFPFQNYSKDYPHIFTFCSQSQPYWEGAHLMAIKEADVVLVIGGSRNSYFAGLASIFVGKTLIPIGSFGGAGEKLLNILENMPDIENKEDFRRLHGPYTDLTLEFILKLMGFENYPKILIIHGRSDDRNDLKDYLQNTLKLPEPIMMEQKFGDGKTLPEKFEYLASHVDAAIALATPDDIGALSIDSENRKKYNFRTRQNVWLEVGWVWGALGRNRIMILRRDDIEIPSDVQGIEVYYYDKKPREKAEQIRLFIENLININ
jgi:hypothetical protein